MNSRIELNKDKQKDIDREKQTEQKNTGRNSSNGCQ